MPKPIIVAHRGYPACYPENSLIGIQAALDAGAQAIEFDIQASADGVPFIFHDQQLQRVTGQDGNITELPAVKLQQLSVSEPQRFGNHYQHARLATLEQLVQLLIAWPDVQVFAEIKAESLQHMPIIPYMQKILSILKPIAVQTYIISYEISVLQTTRQLSNYKIGWVLKTYSTETLQTAQTLMPEILICNHKKIDPAPSLWPGNWQWMLYETDAPAILKKCIRLGADYIETDNIVASLQYMKNA